MFLSGILVIYNLVRLQADNIDIEFKKGMLSIEYLSFYYKDFCFTLITSLAVLNSLKAFCYQCDRQNNVLL